MSKYFKELEFEITPSPGNPTKPTTKVVFNEVKLKTVLDGIVQDLENIKLGVSNLTHYAIDNGNFGSPVGNAFKRLKAAPSIDNAKSFIELARQDLGAKAADHFETELKSAMEVVPNV